MKSLAVYCGSSIGSDKAFRGAARDLGKILAARGITLIYGGGGIGLMGELADATLAGGGVVIGVIPHFLEAKELGHARLSQKILVKDMHERKRKMIDLAEGFLALPGGFGTLDELAEALTWSQLGIHAYPCGLLNLGGFFDGLLAFADRMVESHLLRPEDRSRLLSHDNLEELLTCMAVWRPPATEKWI